MPCRLHRQIGALAARHGRQSAQAAIDIVAHARGLGVGPSVSCCTTHRSAPLLSISTRLLDHAAIDAGIDSVTPINRPSPMPVKRTGPTMQDVRRQVDHQPPGKRSTTFHTQSFGQRRWL